MESPEVVLERTIRRYREKNVLLPTYEQMAHPEKIPPTIVEELKDIGLWDLDSRNLFRITWKNEPVEKGGGFGRVNYLEIPKEITGVNCRIFVLIGKYFPTGSHKVGATFGPLVEKVVHGKFDPEHQKALWPSTGNYCRGGAYNSYLLDVPAIAVLPENMSQERFDWLKKVGADIYATPGCESNVKEVFDKTKALKEEMGDGLVVLNQFAEFGNPLWHYHVTGSAMEEVFEQEKRSDEDRVSGVFLTQGSGGTLGCAYYLKDKVNPKIKIGAGEALQCPTLLLNGYGDHRIEGIGDKHVPWIIDIKSLDVVEAIDDDICMRLLRLFNEPEGHKYLIEELGVDPEVVKQLPLFGISSIANLLGTIKMARYYEFGEKDILFTVGTDSAEMYTSRLRELKEKHGEYKFIDAAKDHDRCLMGLTIDSMIEMNYYDKKRMHHLKYFTWVEQQGMTVEELDAQWYDEKYWSSKWDQVEEWDEKIREFNRKTGLSRDK
eukprot:TRINITY_DN18_c0_g1_i1.p1 TRINITY_DN18_c0_g1~~TRINITY_DN18_c0_g1_i1.p1  ORF type:complete len:491 (-),score=135.70 TRINITY_DN18_c0_g1_i1:333-1805(-)